MEALKSISRLLTGRLSFRIAAMVSAAVIFCSALFMVSPASALEGPGLNPVLLEQPDLQPAEPYVSIRSGSLNEDPSIEILIMDLSGNPIGSGRHSGDLRCILGTCNQSTSLSISSPQTDTAEVEYRFMSLQADDPIARLLVVAGSGTILTGQQKEKFQFTATIQDNLDGTLAFRYEASRPDASFLIPGTPGRLEFTRLP